MRTLLQIGAALGALVALSGCQTAEILMYSTDDKISGFTKEEQALLIPINASKGLVDSINEKRKSARIETIESNNILNFYEQGIDIFNSCKNDPGATQKAAGVTVAVAPAAALVAPLIVPLAEAAFDSAVNAIDERKKRIEKEAKHDYSGQTNSMLKSNTPHCYVLERHAKNNDGKYELASSVAVKLSPFTQGGNKNVYTLEPIFFSIVKAGAGIESGKRELDVNATLAIVGIADKKSTQLLSQEIKFGIVTVGKKYLSHNSKRNAENDVAILPAREYPLFVLPEAETAATLSLAVTETGQGSSAFGDQSRLEAALIKALRGAVSNIAQEATKQIGSPQ